MGKARKKRRAVGLAVLAVFCVVAFGAAPAAARHQVPRDAETAVRMVLDGVARGDVEEVSLALGRTVSAEDVDALRVHVYGRAERFLVDHVELGPVFQDRDPVMWLPRILPKVGPRLVMPEGDRVGMVVRLEGGRWLVKDVFRVHAARWHGR